MLQNFQEMKVNMSLKIHILYFSFEFFPEDLGAVSDEHGKIFYRDIAAIENQLKVNMKRYKEEIKNKFYTCQKTRQEEDKLSKNCPNNLSILIYG